MNIAIVHPYRVRADSVGGVTRVYELARFLARRHRVVIGTHADDGGPGGPLSPDVETPDADLTTMGVAQHACRRPSATGWAKARWWADASAPYYVHRNENPALRELFARMDAAQPFDVVHLELGYMAPVAAGIGRAIRVLAEQEAVPPRLDRMATEPWTGRTPYERLACATRRRAAAFDAATLPTFDLLYGTTPRERDYLSVAAGRPAAVLPHVVSLDRFGAVRPGPSESATVLFVGNFAHQPNVDAVQWFVGEVWPRIIARAGQACFEIVGAGLTDAMRRAFSAPGVVVTGYQPDLASCYGRATVVVSPVRSGGGMRGKVLEALATSSALVSTPLGLEGVAATSGTHCTAAETPRECAEAVLAYLADPAMRRAHGRAARALVAEHYDAPVVFARLERHYEDALACRRPQRRTSVTVPTSARARPRLALETRVSVQIVTWNSARVIEACLASLAGQTSRSFEVVVVDNASTDGTLALVESWRGRLPALTVLSLDRNTGFCTGQNRALSASAAPWVLLLNPDTTLPPEFVARAGDVVATVGPRVGSVAPCLLRVDGSLDSTGLAMDRFRRTYDRNRGRHASVAGRANRDVFGCTGAAALLRRRMLEDVAVNGEVLSEALFAYYDDLDLAWRATLRGWSCRYEPSLVARHERAGHNALVVRDGRVTATRDRQLGVRNRLLVMVRCDRAGDVLLALPWLVPFEMARIVYLLVRAPKVLVVYVDVLRCLGSALRARGAIHTKGATTPLPALPWRVQ